MDAVSIEIETGTLSVLLGPSGCGKSTCLRLIAGLEMPDSGTVSIGGKNVTDHAPAERHLAMVFQSYALFPHLSVAENIIFGLRVRGVDAVSRQRRLADVAQLVGLSGHLDRRPAQLSGGQRQRVALARAIISEKPVCLMDEPLSNLDAQLRHEMRLEIRALQQRLGITMVYVTHDQTEAMTMADTIILMRDGKVEQTGSPAELYGNPASTFVATFLGQPAMNLVASPRTGYLRGVRPEKVTLEHFSSVPSGDRRESGVEGIIESVEYLGADSVITLRAGAETLAARLPGAPTFSVGQSVAANWHSSDEYFFDAASGRRVNLPSTP